MLCRLGVPMISLSSHETMMLKVLHKVMRAGLRPLLWHLDRAGLHAIRDADAAAPISDGHQLRAFLNVPIDPVAKRGSDWILDLEFGISIQGRWPQADICDAQPMIVGMCRPTHTVN